MANDAHHYDSAFRDTVIAGIAELKAQNVMIIAQQVKTNGSITDLFQKTNTLDVNLTAHPLTCPLREKVDDLVRDLETGNHPGARATNDRIMALEMAANQEVAAAATSKKWIDAAKPILHGVLGGLLLLLAYHIRELIQIYRGK